MQNQALTPYLFAFTARQRDAIGAFYPKRRCLALPTGGQNNMSEIVSRCPDLEIKAINLVCEMTKGQDFPRPEGDVVAYELINGTASPCSIGFIRASDFGDGMFSKVKETVLATHAPFVKSWTRNQLVNYAEKNAIVWIQ